MGDPEERKYDIARKISFSRAAHRVNTVTAKAGTSKQVRMLWKEENKYPNPKTSLPVAVFGTEALM